MKRGIAACVLFFPSQLPYAPRAADHCPNTFGNLFACDNRTPLPMSLPIYHLLRVACFPMTCPHSASVWDLIRHPASALLKVCARRVRTPSEDFIRPDFQALAFFKEMFLACSMTTSPPVSPASTSSGEALGPKHWSWEPALTH